MDLYSKIDKNLFNDYINSGKDVLFKLDGKNSPFAKDFIYPLHYKPAHENNQVTTDLFQYIMLINNVNKSNSL